MIYFAETPLAPDISTQPEHKNKIKINRIDSHIRTRQSLKSVEFQGRVLSQRRPIDLVQKGRISLISFLMFRNLYPGPRETYRFSCALRLLLCDFLDCALDLGNVDFLVIDFDHAAEDSADLDQLVLVAGDKVDFC